jgi:hypothetical protein
MAKRSWASAVLVTLLLVTAGCGDDDGGGATTTDTAAGADSRLTQEQWSEYESAKATFLTARAAANAKLDSCPDTSAEVFSRCVGDTLDEVESAATALGDTLTGFEGSVTGECASSTAVLAGYTAPYANAVQMLQDAIDAGNASQIPSLKSTLQTLTVGGSEDTQAFEEACAPV